MYQLRIEGGGNDQWGQSLKPAKTTVKKNDFDFNAAVKNLNNEAKINNANGSNSKKNITKEQFEEFVKNNPDLFERFQPSLSNSSNIRKFEEFTNLGPKPINLMKPRSLEPADPQLPAESIHIYKPDLDKLKDTNGAIIDIHKLPSKFFPRPDGKGGVTMIENPKYDEQMQQLNKPDFRLAIRGEEIPVDKE